MKSILSFILFCCVSVVGISASSAAEIILNGQYHGHNIYLQNPHDGNGNYCIKDIYVNDRQITIPKSTAFDINLDWLHIGDPVLIKIIHSDDCVPKVLNPHAIREAESFRFSNLNASEKGISFVCEGEKKFGQYFIQVKRNKSWVVHSVVPSKGVQAGAEYVIDLTHQLGDNFYRIKYLEVTGKYYISQEVKYYSNDESVRFFPKRVTSKITFTKIVKYEILNSDGKSLQKGEGLTVDCSKLKEGVYNIKFDGKEEKFFKK